MMRPLGMKSLVKTNDAASLHFLCRTACESTSVISQSPSDDSGVRPYYVIVSDLVLCASLYIKRYMGLGFLWSGWRCSSCHRKGGRHCYSICFELQVVVGGWVLYRTRHTS